MDSALQVLCQIHLINFHDGVVDPVLNVNLQRVDIGRILLSIFVEIASPHFKIHVLLLIVRVIVSTRWFCTCFVLDQPVLHFLRLFRLNRFLVCQDQAMHVGPDANWRVVRAVIRTYLLLLSKSHHLL